MIFTCERNVLLKEVAIAQEIIASKNATSILSNMYLDAKEEILSIKSTDLKVNFETTVPVNVEEAGSMTVFGDKFLSILNAVPEGELRFGQTDTRIDIIPKESDADETRNEKSDKKKNKKFKFQLKGIIAENFPEFPTANEDSFFEIPVKDFKEMVTQTIFSVSDDETRYYMTGVFFEKSEDKLIMVATDGRRLAYIARETNSAVPDFNGVIIPPKILTIISKHAGDEGLLAISVSGKNIFIRFGSYNLSSVLIEGTFPNYRRVIPESQNFTVIIDRIKLLSAIRRVSLLAEGNSRKIYLKLMNKLASVEIEENEFGMAQEDIDCQYEGPEFSIALNYRYLEEPFKVMNENDVCIQFVNANKAITICPEPENIFFHVVMPMQI
ncbi:MAG: DNA polymerase III subunit beta [Spirochaetaceae bacterium]|jgi:DNA polymerase-3 subunit beta|nr:DNA polymerase III subunit beta [Spirochaetaceae bacterium]